MRREVVMEVGMAYLAYAVPHTAFHLLHLDHFTALEAAFQISALASSVVVPALLLCAGPTATETGSPGRGGK